MRQGSLACSSCAVYVHIADACAGVHSLAFVQYWLARGLPQHVYLYAHLAATKRRPLESEGEAVSSGSSEEEEEEEEGEEEEDEEEPVIFLILLLKRRSHHHPPL